MVTNKNIKINFISYFLIIRIYLHSTRGICWYSICYICWCNICNVYNFVAHNYWISSIIFWKSIILTNVCGRILTMIFSARTTLFKLAFTFLIWMFYYRLLAPNITMFLPKPLPSDNSWNIHIYQDQYFQSVWKLQIKNFLK